MEEAKLYHAQSAKKNEKVVIAFVIALAGALVLILSFFLPYSSATTEYRMLLEAYPDTMLYDEINLPAKDAINISMLEYAKIYMFTMDIPFYKLISVSCLVLISLILLFSLLTLLFAVLRKPIPLLIFDILTFATFRLLCWDFMDRGIILTSTYVWGASYYLYHVGAAIAFAGAIALLIIDMNAKRQAKSEIAPDSL